MASNRIQKILNKLHSVQGPVPDMGQTQEEEIDNDSVSPVIHKYEKELSRLLGYDPNNPSHKPAELIRKDLVSAMKLPDSEQLASSEYWVMRDPWRQEWEKGVQVPVNPDHLATAACSMNADPVLQTRPSAATATRTASSSAQGPYRLPKNLIRCHYAESGDWFDPDLHYKATAAQQADDVCRYDLDEVDVAWLQVVNTERSTCGRPPLSEAHLEALVEAIERVCRENLARAIQGTEGLGIEYDETVKCDVCKGLDAEEGNEMVFCDQCDVCVHQACYGISKVPKGDWLCRPCALGVSPNCIFCPRRGGALKSTKSGTKWGHVSCALWIPEVSIGDSERMEPVTKISQIPGSRWALVCSLCKEKVGACIQCCVKSCKVAFHVTCGFTECLEMSIRPEADDVSFRAYCAKHTRQRQDMGGGGLKSPRSCSLSPGTRRTPGGGVMSPVAARLLSPRDSPSGRPREMTREERERRRKQM